MTSQPLVLASTSPYRRELLQRLDLPFSTARPAVDETPLAGESPEALVRRLSEAKARAVAKQFSDALIIGSDQVAVRDGIILGKPGDHETARTQLRAASGKCVRFLTGLCLLNMRSATVEIDLVPYTVHFRRLTDTQIEHYLAREKPYDCAGSFKSEGLGIALFESMEGEDPSALVGLPLIRLVTMLATNGVEVLNPPLA